MKRIYYTLAYHWLEGKIVIEEINAFGRISYNFGILYNNGYMQQGLESWSNRWEAIKAAVEFFGLNKKFFNC